MRYYDQFMPPKKGTGLAATRSHLISRNPINYRAPRKISPGRDRANQNQGTMGFFDLSRRYEGVDAWNDPLMKLDAAASWERFRGKPEAALCKAGRRKAAEERKSNAGRPPWDAVLMFKVLVLAALYSLADEHKKFDCSRRPMLGRLIVAFRYFSFQMATAIR